MKSQKNFTFIDLFAGIGGFRLALDAHGGQCLGFSEIDKDAIATYCDNFNESEQHNLGDIRTIQKLPSHDLMTAGVPCQSWSIAGKNLGFDDDRGQLWNDTIYLLKKAQPKAFIFENVKGLVDPRNKTALAYILDRIRLAGYHANSFVINSFDYGVLQNRIRVYIVGFKQQDYFHRFRLPYPQPDQKRLGDLLGLDVCLPDGEIWEQKSLFGDAIASQTGMSLSSNQGFNDYFLFNDLRNGHSTIHSWDILETSERQKHLCYLLLKNRRKSIYGKLDGNPLSLTHFQSLDPTVEQWELDELTQLGIFAAEEYLFTVNLNHELNLSSQEQILLKNTVDGSLIIDDLKSDRTVKLQRIPLLPTLESLKIKGVLQCQEVRYDFRNTKISTGLFGISRIFLPSSTVFPTLVSSDTHDYIALKDIKPTTLENYKQQFLHEIYHPGNYRKISQEEACLIQGFPSQFKLPSSRARWMKLIGNSVSVPVISRLCEAMIETGVFQSSSVLARD